jgi:hypothetical protein
MALKLNGSTDGSVSIDAPADTSPTGSDITLTLPTTVGSANQFVKNGGTAGELEYSSMVETSSGDVQARRDRSDTVGDVALSVQPSDSSIHYGLRIDATNNNLHLDKASGTADNLLTIDNSGQVGINNSSPDSYYAKQLVVDTGNATQSGITIKSGTSAQGMLAFADGTSGNQRYQGFMDYNHSSSIMTFGVNGNTHGAFRNGGHFNASSSGNFYGDSNPDFHSFNQDESGQWTLGIRNEDSNPYGFIVRYDTDTNNAGNECYYFIADGTTRYYVRANGGIVNYQSNNANLCDEREKKNIVDLDTKWDKVKSWELKKFHYNEDADTDNLRYGVIAQQIEEHCPEVLTEWEKRKAEDAVLDADGNVVTPAQEQVIRKGVMEQQMMWMAIKALQEAQTRIETLETKVAALEAAE